MVLDPVPESGRLNASDQIIQVCTVLVVNGWMDARQGNPVRTPARATLAGAMDDACMVLLYLMRQSLRPPPHRCLGKVLVLITL